MSKYSRFGLSFLKPFLIDKGANPVLYVARNSPEFPFGLPGTEGVCGPLPRRDIFEGNIRLYRAFYEAIMWADPSPFRESKPGQHTEEQSMLHTLNYFFSTLPVVC